ncbi:MAG: hypothetical protein WAU40_07575, partial [Nitrospira sp.]
MKKHINTSAYLVVGFLSICLNYSSVVTVTAWASEGQEKAGAPAPTFGLEATIPDGVIGVSLHVGAERVGDTAVLYVAHVLP